MKQARTGFIFRWPLIAILGVLLLGLALVFAAIAVLYTLVRRDSALYILLAVACLFASSYAWGYVLSNVGDNGSDVRTFPFNFFIWLFHPPPRGEAYAVGHVEPHDFRMAPYYLVAIGFIAIIRLAAHVFKREPLVDDLVSIRDPENDGDFLLAEVTSRTLTEVSVTPLRRCSGRPRTVRLDGVAPIDAPFTVDPVEYRQLKPKLIWRGEREFWERSSREERRRGRSRYRAIELAARNVEAQEFRNERLRVADRASSSTRESSEYSRTAPRSGPRS